MPEIIAKQSLRKELILVLVLKLILIWGIWYVFFSNPIDENLTPEQFANTVFSSKLVNENKPGINPVEGDHD